MIRTALPPYDRWKVVMVEMLRTAGREAGPPQGPPALVVLPTPRREGASAEGWSSDGATETARAAGFTRRMLLTLGVKRLLFAADLAALTAPLTVLSDQAVLPVAGFAALTLLLLLGGGLYRPRLTLSLLHDVPQIVGRALLGGAVVAATSAAVDVATLLPQTAVLATAGLLAARGLAYALVLHLRRKGWTRHPALVLGAGHVGRRVVRTLQTHRELGLRPVGLLDDDPRRVDHEQPLAVLGGTEDLAAAVRATGAEVVIVAFGRRPESEMVSILRTCDRLECAMFFVPRLFEIGAYGDLDRAWDIPLVRLRRTGLRTGSQLVKRVMDVCLASAALLILSPLLLAVAAAVRWTSGPGVIFRQVRCGIDGRQFTLLKFRTLNDRDPMRAQTQWSVTPQDAGRLGRFLRRTSIDELPQLWNVIRGEMSLVGPRPERPYFVQEYARTHRHYAARHRVRSGLTGYAQAKGLRGDTSIADRIAFDNDYIENWSLWLDLKIMLWTLRSVVRASGS